MGYMTQYTLSASNIGDVVLDELGQSIFEMNQFFEGVSVPEDSKSTGVSATWVIVQDTWHSCMEDMTSLSFKFPNILFTLYGVGELEGDLWVMYFYAGKHHGDYATITYPDFDATLLNPYLKCEVSNVCETR